MSQCHLPFTIMSSLSFVVVIAIRLKCVTRDCYVCFSRFFNFNFFVVFFLYFFSDCVNFYFCFIIIAAITLNFDKCAVSYWWSVSYALFDRSFNKWSLFSLTPATGCILHFNVIWYGLILISFQAISHLFLGIE